MRRRMKGASGTDGDTGDRPGAVNVRVRVYPGTDGEIRGTVVEDFGDLAGHVVDIGENHIVGAARRRGLALDEGAVVFVDSDQLVPGEFALSRVTHRRATIFPRCGPVGQEVGDPGAQPQIAL